MVVLFKQGSLAFLHEEEEDHSTTDERKEYGAEDR